MVHDRGAGGCPPSSACPASPQRVREARAAFVRRGLASSVVTTMLAAISHTVAGGPAPAPSIVLGMIVLLIVPSALLLQAPAPRIRGRAPRVGRRVGGLARIALTTVVAQLAFHGAFSALGSPIAGEPVIGGHHHGALPEAVAAHAHAGGPAMLASHAVAALVTIAILAYGENVIRRGAGWIRRAARAAAPLAPLPLFPRILVPVRPRIRAIDAWIPAVGLRGPPVFS